MPNHCGNDLIILGDEETIDALLTLMGVLNEQPVFDFNILIPYPDRFREMDEETGVIHKREMALWASIRNFRKEASVRLLALISNDEVDQVAFLRELEAIPLPDDLLAERDAIEALYVAYEAKWGTRSDGFNSGGYNWCCSMWGTKWGAYEVSTYTRDHKRVVSFETAWSPPSDDVLSALHRKFPTLTLHHEWFERGVGQCGGSSWRSESDWYEDEPWEAGKATDEWSGTYGGHRGG